MTRSDGTGSAFTDVLAYDAAPLVQFGLFHRNGKESVILDLQSGNFSVNSTPVSIHNQFFDPTKYPLKLIYFRETRAEQDNRATVQADLSIKEEVTASRHYVNRYFIGWETVVHGKNKQVTLAVG